MDERFSTIVIYSSLQLLSRLLIAPSQCLQSLEQCARIYATVGFGHQSGEKYFLVDLLAQRVP